MTLKRSQRFNAHFGRATKRFWPLLLAFVIWVPGAASADGATGLWQTEGGKSHVQIGPCGERLCGTIVWLQEPLDDDGKAKTDANNPDEALRQRPIIGLPLLRGFLPGSEVDVWEGGTIYNPEDGETYKSVMTLLSRDELKVRGYVGLPLFGKSQIWSRVK